MECYLCLRTQIELIPCFQYTDKEVMLYYDSRQLHMNEEPYCKEQYISSLLSYNMETNDWSLVAKNLPIPLCPSFRRNLVYVGDNILFIIDYAYLMFVYDLSSTKKVGEVRVDGLDHLGDEGVFGAFYAGDTDIKSTSWVFYLFLPMPNPDYTDDCPSDLRYAKVEVVQGKGGDYAATVQMKGVLNVGDFYGIYIIADREIAKNEVKTKECSNALVGKALLPTKRAREPLLKEIGKEKIDEIK